MSHFHHLLAGLAVAGSLLHARETRQLDEGLLAALRAEAARTHPSTSAATFRAAAALSETRAVRLWSDPMFEVGFMGADRMMRESDGDVMVGIAQPLPKPGMFAAERQKAGFMARAEKENARSAALAAGTEAARNAIELALADEAEMLLSAQVRWMETMAENARQMAADPMAGSNDALRLETELAKERQMLASTRRNRTAFAQKLNISLGRPPDQPWPELRLPPTPPPVPVAVAEIARIPRLNPKVRAMHEMAAAAAAETRMADRERQPEISVGVDTRFYSGGDYRSSTLGIRMSLPWFNESSYRSKIDAARHREHAASADIESMRREIAVMVVTATTEAANAAAEARAYGGEIQTKAAQSTESLKASWISSKAPLMDLLDSSRNLFAIRLEEKRFIAMQLSALEELHSLLPRN